MFETCAFVTAVANSVMISPRNLGMARPLPLNIMQTEWCITREGVSRAQNRSRQQGGVNRTLEAPRKMARAIPTM